MSLVSLILLMTAMILHVWPTASLGATAGYEESLKQLAQEVTAKAVKARKQRLAFLDFTDIKGNATPLGRFLAEEVGTQVLVAGELNVVDRTLVQSTLKKLHVDQIDRAHAKAVRRAAKAIRADAFVSGSYFETPEDVQVTAKLISPLNAQVVGTVRGTFPKDGPLGERLKEVNKPLVATIEGPGEPPLPAGLGFHRNEHYELVVQSIEEQDGRAKLDVTIENRTPHDLKVLCLLQGTTLKDDHGAVWPQEVEDNGEGLCVRGLELAPRQKEQTVLTFSAPPDASASRFTLQYHEELPRRDATFTIDGIKVDSGAVAAPINPQPQ